LIWQLVRSKFRGHQLLLLKQRNRLNKLILRLVNLLKSQQYNLRYLQRQLKVKKTNYELQFQNQLRFRNQLMNSEEKEVYQILQQWLKLLKINKHRYSLNSQLTKVNNVSRNQKLQLLWQNSTTLYFNSQINIKLTNQRLYQEKEHLLNLSLTSLVQLYKVTKPVEFWSIIVQFEY
jgi:hypothetical protein